MVEYDYKAIGSKLRELDNIRASLQGKTKTSLLKVISIIITIFFAILVIAYFIFIDWQMDEFNFEVLLVFIICFVFQYVFHSFAGKINKIDKKIDTIIKLLDLEKLADNRYAEQIKEITNTPQTS